MNSDIIRIKAYYYYVFSHGEHDYKNAAIPTLMTVGVILPLQAQ